MKMDKTNHYADVLKHKGLKNTKHRNSILAILEKCSQPITAEQVFIDLLDQKVSINLSSVYRILEALVLNGIVIKSTITGDNKALFELNHLEHKHYLICSCCKKMLSVEGCPLEEYEKKLQDKMDFYVTGHTLEIFGLCKECKQKNK